MKYIGTSAGFLPIIILCRFRLALAICLYYGGAGGSPDKNRLFQHIRRRIADIQASCNYFVSLKFHTARGASYLRDTPDSLHEIAREQRREQFHPLIAYQQPFIS